MQDVHWPSGGFGYFPSYTLGAMTAAQLASAMQKDLPSMNDDIRRGDFTAINQWRADKIWSQASRYSTPDLITKATGEKLNADYFKSHLKRRYSA
jgi:carboxypeptidase Taq